MDIPDVVDFDGGQYSMDLLSYQLSKRIIWLYGSLDLALANLVVAQLLYLEHKESHKDIYLYIHSPGGSVRGGMAIYDTINYINSHVHTIAIGGVASIAAVLLASGTKGKRCALANSEIMIHQPLGEIEGSASDMEIKARHMLNIKNKINYILSIQTGQPIERVADDTERDCFLTSEEALNYGLIDIII